MTKPPSPGRSLEVWEEHGPPRGTAGKRQGAIAQADPGIAPPGPGVPKGHGEERELCPGPGGINGVEPHILVHPPKDPGLPLPKSQAAS